MSTKLSTGAECSGMVDPRRRRRRQRGFHFRSSNDDAVSVSVSVSATTIINSIPSLLILLLLCSGNDFPECDAFRLQQLPSLVRSHRIQKPQTPTTPTTAKELFRRPQPQPQPHCRTNNPQQQHRPHRSFAVFYARRDGGAKDLSSTKNKNNTKYKYGAAVVDSELLSSNSTEVSALRARAEELRAEARAMELELRQKAFKERRERDAITDEIIETLFLPLQYQVPNEPLWPEADADADAVEEESDEIVATTTTPWKVIDARVVADRLRQGKFTRPQIMSVVDRLYEHRHGHDSSKPEEFDPLTINNASKTQPEDQKEHRLRQLHNMDRYKLYFKVLTRAAVLLDESIVANSVLEGTATNVSPPTLPKRIPRNATSSSASSITSSSLSKAKSSASSPLPSSFSSQSTLFVTSGQLTKSIHTRINELRQRNQVELNRKRAAEANRIAAMSPSSSSPTSSSSSTALRYSGTMNGTGTVRASAIWASSSSSEETPSFIPLWIPSPYIPYILSLAEQARSSLPSPSPSPQNNTTDDSFTAAAETISTTAGGSPSTPPVAAPFTILTNSTLDTAEMEILRDKVLMGSRFYVTSYEFAPGAALFRGNLRTSLGNVPPSVPASSPTKTNNRTAWFARQNQNRHTTATATATATATTAQQPDNNTAMVFADIQERLKKAGLEDRVQLFVLPDPEAVFAGQPDSNRRYRARTTAMGMMRPGIDAGSSSEAIAADAPKPVILALPKALTPDESKLKRSWFHRAGKVLCYPIAAFLTCIYSFCAYALNPTFFDAIVHQRDFTVLKHCLPLTLGVLAVQIIHEAAHYLVAKRKKIKTGPPVPIPSVLSDLPFFGWITPLRSFPSNRAALVDFALSGPMAALTVSLGLVFAGVALTSRATALDIAGYPFLSVSSLKSSFLVGSILSWLLPKTMMLPLAQPIPMHPLFVVGSFGLVSSALNLLPIFRLDGGRACFAALGQRSGAIISAGTVLWIVGNFFSGKTGGVPSPSPSMLFYWTVLVALFQSRVEIPCRDECTEVGGKRQWLWLTSFLLSLSILVPFPKSGTGI